MTNVLTSAEWIEREKKRIKEHAALQEKWDAQRLRQLKREREWRRIEREAKRERKVEALQQYMYDKGMSLFTPQQLRAALQKKIKKSKRYFFHSRAYVPLSAV